MLKINVEDCQRVWGVKSVAAIADLDAGGGAEFKFNAWIFDQN